MSRRRQTSARSAHPEIENIVERLTEAGARVVDGSALRADHGCTLDLRPPTHGAFTVWRVALDVDGATYRHTGSGQQIRICDFLAAWCSREPAWFSVAEMKSGKARDKALEQLQAGLDLIDRLDVDKVLRAYRAWLVCGHQNDQLKKLLQTRRKTALRFRNLRVPVVVLRCGERVTLGGGS